MPVDWDQLITSYLHDPPGKAFDLRTHETRASQLLSIALGEAKSRQQLHVETRTEDTLASRLERVVPLPPPGANFELAVGVENEQLQIRHPFSGKSRSLHVGALLTSDDEQATLRELVVDLDPPRARAMLIWRRWRERLMQRQREWGLLPADTRLPDHTIWNHTDAVMGIAGAKDQHGITLLSFSLGPVQPFIAAARTVRDLWTGSYLLSWLTFAAMKPILQAFGPAAVVMPALRGNPLMDHWLRSLRFDECPDAPCLLEDRLDSPPTEQLLSPCLPNRFIALVPLGREGESADEMAKQCQQSCREEWLRICDTVRRRFDQALRHGDVPHSAGWDRLWDAQVGSFFEMHTATLPLNDCTDETLGPLLAESGGFEDAFGDVAQVRRLADAIPPTRYDQRHAGQWMGAVELLGRLMAAHRSLRPLPSYDAAADQGNWPGKCSLLGTYEQLGPGERGQADQFWNQAAQLDIRGVRLGQRERLCAVSLVKRFAWSAYLADQLKCDVKDLKYPDTATVAATVWLRENDLTRDAYSDWSGQWLHWSKPQSDDPEEPSIPSELWARIRQARQQNAPPAYYAILMMDGDHMGRWLRGDQSPTVRDALAEKLRRYYEGLPQAAEGLRARRPLGPAMQMALSEALTNFALHAVPRIVREHQGTLIYAGGDDVLALLPTTTALACAVALQQAYRQDWDDDGRLFMGERATLSAGLAAVHYKEDLRVSLQAARNAEKLVKQTGRNALGLRIVRRSGEDSSVVVGWSEVAQVQALVDDFLGDGQRRGASDRWAYRLRAELPTLQGLPQTAFEAELCRLLARMEQPPEGFSDRVVELWKQYSDFCTQLNRQIEPLASFVTLCQSASFLARGRDQ